MKKRLLSVGLFAMSCLATTTVSAQIGFDPEIEFDTVPTTVLVPPSPIQSQVVFIGGHDSVQTTATYGNPAGAQVAKQWHDFIGFTPETDPSSPDLGWISINHERVDRDSLIGDGGGMTVFKIRRDGDTDSIIVVPQTLPDGRQGMFFNVDFVNTVGETGMNCGGIVSEADGRIWTAEEWWRYSNAHIYDGGNGVLDTIDFTINGSGIPMADGVTIKKYQNFNWMVEIDPKEAKAIRKQYNWGRQPFEGGVVMPDNKTVYTGADATPGIFSKFVADTPGDFTAGKLYAYREDDSKLRLSHRASLKGTHSEISAYDPATSKIYSTRSDVAGIMVSQITAMGIDSVDFIDLSAFGEPTSVDFKNGVLAVAIPNANPQLNGTVLLASTATTPLSFNQITVGALPDMVKFSPNGNYLVVANEGEPNDDYTVDPEGSVSVIDLSSGVATATVNNATFSAFNLSYQQGFEGASDNWNYTIAPATYNVSGDVWATVSALSSITPSEGAQFFGAQDLENPNGGGAFPHTIDFDAIDVSIVGGTKELTFSYYTIGYDATDSLGYYLEFDNGTTWSNYTALSKNTLAWDTVTVTVPTSANYVRLRIAAVQNGAGDYAGFDNFQLNMNPYPGMKLQKGSVAQDLEPEYVAINSTSTKAYVVCQENNAFAVVDIATATVDTIIGFGFKDYSVTNNWIDASDQDGIDGNFKQWDNVYGMYQPDAITIQTIGGVDYIVSANEGDARDYAGFSEEVRVSSLTLDPTAFPTASTIQQNTELGRLKVTTSLGDTDGDGDYDELYSYGARSFSIWTTDGTLVYDSGNEFGKILAEKFPDNYASNRDDDKGSEPESISVMEISGKTFAFIGLERATGVMVYDITDPANAFFVNYYNKNGVDRSPEGLLTIAATDNPANQNILVSTNESFGSYGGSISLYNINGLDGKKWIEINNGSMEKMLNFTEEAINAGATMFNRLEWVAYNAADQNIYITETGRDNPASRWKDEECEGGVIAQLHYERATAQGTNPLAADYVDYYGRVLKFDTANDTITVALAAGPEYNNPADSNIAYASYPAIHLSNPDGLTFMKVGTKTYMVICEDLNGISHGRMPAGVSNKACELFILDMSIANASISDLVRIAQVPKGAEVTGVRATPDGKTLFFNSQHPKSSNPFPYNNSLTIALTGWEKIAGVDELGNDEDGFAVYPNPTARFVNFDEVMDIAIYNSNGQLIQVERNIKQLDIIGLDAGVYYIKNQKGQTKKLILQ